MKINAEIQKQLEAYFGKDVAIEIDKVADIDTITKSLEVINEYRGDFPDDLKDAVRAVAKQAAQFVPGAVAEEGKGSVEKAGAKLSKDTMKKITDALNTLKSLVPALKEKSDGTEDAVAKAVADITKQLAGALGTEAEATGDDDIAKTLEGINKKLTALEGKSKGEGEGEGEKTDLAKTLKGIAKRLSTIEKETGVKKSLDSSNDDEEGEGIEKSGNKWPSFQV